MYSMSMEISSERIHHIERLLGREYAHFIKPTLFIEKQPAYYFTLDSFINSLPQRPRLKDAREVVNRLIGAGVWMKSLKVDFENGASRIYKENEFSEAIKQVKEGKGSHSVYLTFIRSVH